MRIKTNSPAATAALGGRLAKSAKSGEIFALVGDLGGGKTCFTKGFAKSLGIKRPVQSPSFVLMKIYRLKKRRLKKFCHLDAYRLKNPAELAELGLDEYLGRPGVVTVIEWADKIKKMLAGREKTTIKFLFTGQNSREIIIKKA